MPRYGSELMDKDDLSRAQKAQKEYMKSFIELAKKCPWSFKEDGDWIITDEKGNRYKLEPSSIKISFTHGKVRATCGINRLSGVIKLKIKTDFWHNADAPKLFGVAAHEIIHIRHHHHKPIFWNSLKRHLKKYAKDHEYVETLFGDEISFDEVYDYIRQSIHRGSVDRRSESVDARREEMKVISDYGKLFGKQNKELTSQIAADKEK